MAMNNLKAMIAGSNQGSAEDRNLIPGSDDIPWGTDKYVVLALLRLYEGRYLRLPMLGRESPLTSLRDVSVIYIACVAIFAVGSIIAIASTSFPMFLIARAIQAFGAGGIFPVATAAIADRVPPERRGAALGLVAATWGVAAVVGPLQVNQMSQPIPTNDGMMLFMVCARKDPPKRTPPTKEQVGNQLYLERLDMQQQRYLSDLRSSGFVDVRV